MHQAHLIVVLVLVGGVSNRIGVYRGWGRWYTELKEDGAIGKNIYNY